MNEEHGKGWFFVGEFWKDSLQDMGRYLERMSKKFSLFDAPLVHKFSQLSKNEKADLTKVFDDTLVKVAPVNAVVCCYTLLQYPVFIFHAPAQRGNWY